MNISRYALKIFCLCVSCCITTVAYPASLVWSTTDDISSIMESSGYQKTNPKIVYSGDGAHAIAIWMWYCNENPCVQSASAVISGDNVEWGSVYTIGPWSSGGAYYPPDISLSSDGTKATAVWVAEKMVLSVSANIDRTSATWSKTGGTLAPQIVGLSESNVKFGLSRDGTRAVAIYKYGSQLYSSTAKITGNSAIWSEKFNIGYATGGLDVKISSDGSKVLALWVADYNTPGMTTGMRYIKSAVGTVSGNSIQWGVEENISSSNNMNFYAPELNMSTDGAKATAVWGLESPVTLSTPGWNSIQSASAMISGSAVFWGAVNTIAENNISPGGWYFPDSALSSDGTKAIIVWYEPILQKEMSASALISGSQAYWGQKSYIDSGYFYPIRSSKVRLSHDGSRAIVLINQGLKDTQGEVGNETIVSYEASILDNIVSWSDGSEVPLKSHKDWRYGNNDDKIYIDREIAKNLFDFDISPLGKSSIVIFDQYFAKYIITPDGKFIPTPYS